MMVVVVVSAAGCVLAAFMAAVCGTPPQSCCPVFDNPVRHVCPGVLGRMAGKHSCDPSPVAEGTGCNAACGQPHEGGGLGCWGVCRGWHMAHLLPVHAGAVGAWAQRVYRYSDEMNPDVEWESDVESTCVCVTHDVAECFMVWVLFLHCRCGMCVGLVCDI